MTTTIALPLDVLILDADIQPRATMSKTLIQEYAELYHDGHTLPPITVFQDGAGYWVADGFHRTEGARQAGLTEISVALKPGTKRDAILYSCGANKHGKARTPGDRKRAVKRLLQDPIVLEEWTNEQIAQHCGVVESFVRKVKCDECDEPRPYRRSDNRTSAIVLTPLGKRQLSEDLSQTAPPTEIEAALAGPTARWDPFRITEEPADDISRAEIEARFPPAARANSPDAAQIEELVVEEGPLLETPALILIAQTTGQMGPPSRFNRTNEQVDWAKWTWNPVTGCLHDCEYCYARDIATRFYPEKFKPTFRPERLSAPYHTHLPKEADGGIGWRNVFVCSMADLFGKWVPDEWIDAVLAEVRAAPQWNFLFLTKFPQRLAGIDWPGNTWVGTTVDEQYRVKIAEKAFRDIKASVKWLSCEPLRERLTFDSLEMFDWVVIGGQSASSRAPAFQPPSSWVEHLLFQARGAGCKVFCKENLHVWPREYPVQRPESLDLPRGRDAVERAPGGEEGAIEVAGSGSHQAEFDRGIVQQATQGRGLFASGEAPIVTSTAIHEPEDGERRAPAARADEASSVALAESEQISLTQTGGPHAGQVSGNRPQTVRERARALKAAGFSPEEIVAKINAEEGRRRYNLGAVLAMLRPKSH